MILEQIVADCKKDLEGRKKTTPLEKLKAIAYEQAQPLDFARALRGNSVRLIAEVKKASPSKGVICADFNPVAIAQAYARGGAAAISVLTENRYFQGSLGYLSEIKIALKSNAVPLLRKDFIFDPYQVYEARAYGADALLLIVAILKPSLLSKLLDLSHKLNMKCLVEVHNETELETALKSGAEIIGINNRDLKTFSVDINVTGRLRPFIPSDRVVVSESGIKSRDDIAQMRRWGINAVLVGEALMSASDIPAKIKELL